MKKILFLNTTKLAVLSAMLLLAVFCTIGMSFTPAEEGENVGNPNDSTYVTGPRRSHWKITSSCMGQTETTYNNETDYAQVAAVVKVYDESGADITSTVTNVGTVTLTKVSTSNETGAVEDGSPSGNGTTSAYINWNSSVASESKDKSFSNGIIANAHKLGVRFTAACIDGNYNFVGWYKATGMSDSDFKEGAAEFSEVICIGGGTTPGVGYGSYEEGTHNIKTYGDNDRYTVTYYACFKPKANVTVTLKATENGSYTYSDGTLSGTISSADDSINTKAAVTLEATPASGYKFFGWYEIKDGKETYFSYNASTGKTFQTNDTIYAKFIPSNWATYIVRNKPEVQYYDFQAAADAVATSTDTVFLPLVDGVVPAGNYTIPSGVTLLIPYDEANTVVTTTPPSMSITQNTPTPKVYRLLTLANGVNITLGQNAAISVASQQYLTDTSKDWAGQGVLSNFGMIYMEDGSQIILNNGSYLYAWGYISGDGKVTANSGAKVYEMFQVKDFRGGKRTGAMTTDNYSTLLGESTLDKKIFPLQSYYVQNIESELIINDGAYDYVRINFWVSDKEFPNTVPYIGKSDAMFAMGENAQIKRKYDRLTDRIHYVIIGEVNLREMTLEFKFNVLFDIEIPVNSGEFVLPLNSNISVDVTSYSSFTLTQDMSLLPGVKINIEKDAKVTINKGCKLYVYDTVEWKGKGCVFSSVDIRQLWRVGRNHNNEYGAPFVRQIDTDAQLNIDGTLIVNGELYTTSSGADICSTGTGKIVFNSNAGTDILTYQDKNNNDVQEIPITPAQLHNGEEWYKDKEGDFKKEYLATAGVSASTTIQYANNHWGWMEIWKDHDGTILNINNTCTQTNESSAYEHNVLPEGYTFIGWSTEVSDTNQEVIHTAQYTFGPELDIVDADNTKKTLTINANGWASSGWPYTVDGVKYDKGDREDDRTLIIPYNGTAGASLPIAVLDKDGKPICRHIYKVPFVYTGNATMSGTDSTSIVFVKSGTLTVGTASAKEIYVADSAELKVTGTLTVGKLVLRTTPYKAAILTNNGTIDGQVYYSRISPNSEQYYQFGLPLSCALANVKMSNTDKLGGSQPKYGTAWMLKSYSESSRANNGIKDKGANWNLLPSDGTITAGVGYEMFSNSNYYREFYFPVDLTTATNKVSVRYTGGTISAEHNGWNIITSPLTSRANVPIIDPATAFKVCWLDEKNGSYRQKQDTVIPPAIPFSIQASAEGELNFAVPTIAAAPRKQSAAEALTETEWVHLDIFDAYGEGDETSLFVHPTRFEQTYKTGIDMAKQSLTASRPIIYSTHAYGDMAFAGVADSLLKNGIDLVVYSPAAQELTFSLRENKFLNRLEYLWLADNETGARTDLLMNDYTFRADAGTAKGRFVLNGRFKAPQISTGIGNTQTDYNIYAIGNNIAISGVEQGTPIYVFDAVGHMIYTTAATSDEVIVPAPCAGVYMLSVGGQTAKLVINQ